MQADKKGAATSCKDALTKWQEKFPNIKLAEAKKVSLLCQLPSINKMDNALNVLTACEHLSLSTNAIDKINPLPGLKSLRILSLGRNNIKKIEKLEDVANTLEELWLSYNAIEKLDGLLNMQKLRVLYLSNNNIKSFDELLKLKELPALEELLLLGNPMYEDLRKEERIREVLLRLPNLKKLDGEMITEKARQHALNPEQPHVE